jgi:hypothetical protein
MSQDLEKLIVKRTEAGYELYFDEKLVITLDTVEEMEALFAELYGDEEPVEYTRRPQ